MDLANWALRTTPKFTPGVKYQFIRVFDQIRDPDIWGTRVIGISGSLIWSKTLIELIFKPRG